MLVACSSKAVDDCERAIARLERLQPSKAPAPNRSAQIEACRTGKISSWDPVLRCAMDSATDEAAAACIKTGIDGVLKGTAADGDGAGSGVNPLLQ